VCAHAEHCNTQAQPCSSQLHGAAWLRWWAGAIPAPCVGVSAVKTVRVCLYAHSYGVCICAVVCRADPGHAHHHQGCQDAQERLHIFCRQAQQAGEVPGLRCPSCSWSFQPMSQLVGVFAAAAWPHEDAQTKECGSAVSAGVLTVMVHAGDPPC
jgi:hypothetical protein